MMTRPKNPIPGVVYHPAEAVARYRDLGVLKEETLGQVLHDVAVRHADRVAVIGPADGTRWIYRELDERSDRFGAALLELGLQPLDPVMFQIGNVPEFFVALYGCFKAGLIPVCTLPAHRDEEIGYIARLVGAKAHIVQGDLKFDLVAFGRKMAAQVDGLSHLIVAHGQAGPDLHSIDSLIARVSAKDARARLEALDIDPWNVGIYQLSGGTTGLPKVIPRFHSEYICNIRSWAEVSRLSERTVALWPLPAIHNAAIIAFNTPAHFVGGAAVAMQEHDPENFLGTIERERVTLTGGALPVIVRCIDAGIIGRYDLSSVDCFITLGETPTVLREFKVPAYHIFGMAEGLCMRTHPEDPEEVRLNCIGRPINPYDEVRLVKIGAEEPVAPGEVGEFLARGPYTIRGYFKADEHNAKAFTADGYYRTGDLMKANVIDGVTYYSFEGRAKDNIDRGAEKISAEEVERYVLRHPAVRECMVIGMPDRVMGERVCAYIILRDGHAAPSVAELADFITAQGLARFKSPERIEVVDNFPVTKVGKTSKGLLREDIKRKLEAERAAQRKSG
ncbi:MAG TPA: AMP-binding protein [Alphaproteobacteria bacterium]